MRRAAAAGRSTRALGLCVEAAAIRDATRDDHEDIIALNRADVAHLSEMNLARLSSLAGLSCYHRVVCVEGRVLGFLLAMRDGAQYCNENFAWFSRNFHSFVYVDRIVVSSTARGLGLGSLLYKDLFVWARRNGIPYVTCEYNIVPANETSRLFHDRFGFKEQGTHWVAGRTKQVSLQSAEA
jgi:uncharacterized protein